MTTLRAVERRIAQLRQELEELERTAAILRRLGSGLGGDDLPDDGSDDAQSGGDLAGASLTVAAMTVLQEAGEELYYAEVAERALARGYRGNPGSSPDSVRDSFRRGMGKKPDIFEPTGGGKYRLKETKKGKR